MYKSISMLLVFSILLQTFPTAQAAPWHDVRSAEDVLASYTFPGEKAYTLHPGIEYQGVKYEIHYFTRGAFNQTSSRFIVMFADASFLQKNTIEGMLITGNGKVVENEDEIRNVLSLYRSAYYLYEQHGPASLGYVDDDFVNEMRNLANITQFTTLNFPDRVDDSAEALRLMLSSRLSSPEDVNALSEALVQGAESGQTIVRILDMELTNTRFSNEKFIRQAGPALRQAFIDWRVLSDNSKQVSLAGKIINLSNGLKLLSLGTQLMWLHDMQKDRADWLTHYQKISAGEAVLDPYQATAAGIVTNEIGNEWAQRQNVIREFVEDEIFDWAVDKTIDAFVTAWAKSAFKTYGTRIRGHAVAGLASDVAIGITIGNLIYGLEDVNECFWLGIRLDDFRRTFRTGRLNLEAQTGRQSMLYYDGELSEDYRSAYMMESLAAARMLSSYADGVAATVRDNLFSFLNPIKWFKGKEWKDAVAQLRELSVKAEQEAEDTLGHPQFIEPALKSIRIRIAQVRLLVDDSSARFSKYGPAKNWQSMQGGVAGSATWTYNEAKTSANAGRWQPEGVTEGLYRIEAFIPASSSSGLPPYTTSAHYSLFHFGQSIPIQRNMQKAQGGWLDLGIQYLEGAGDEYIELIDLTNEASGEVSLVFDAVRLTPQDIRPEDYQVKFGTGLVSEVASPGETVQLKFSITNVGPMPWKTNGNYAFQPYDPSSESTLPVFYIDKTILTGDSLEFTVDVPINAEASGGMETIQYIVTRSGQTVGEPTKGYIFILPPQLKEYREQLAQKLEEWKQQGVQYIEDLINQIWEDIQRRLMSQLEKQLNEWLAQCYSSGLLLGGLAMMYGYRRRAKNRKK